MERTIVRVFSTVSLLGGLLLLLLGLLFIEGAPSTAPRPEPSLHHVRDLAALRAVPPGQKAVIFGTIADDMPSTPFIVENNGEQREWRLVVYQLWARQDAELKLVREEKPRFIVALTDGALPVVNTDYTLDFSYFRRSTPDGVQVHGQEPGEQITVIGTVEEQDGGLGFRAVSVTDLPQERFRQPGGSPSAADTANGIGLMLVVMSLAPFAVGLLLLNFAGKKEF